MGTKKAETTGGGSEFKREIKDINRKMRNK